MTERRLTTVETDLKHLKADLEEVKAISLANQKLLRWGMGAAAGAGAMLPLVLPKLAEALGWS